MPAVGRGGSKEKKDENKILLCHFSHFIIGHGVRHTPE
jgi:hypothetical protein